LDVIDHPSTSPPCIKQSGNVLLSLRIVALAPGLLIKAFLHIDNDEGCTVGENNYVP